MQLKKHDGSLTKVIRRQLKNCVELSRKYLEEDFDCGTCSGEDTSLRSSINAEATGIGTIKIEEKLVLDRLLKLDSRKSPGPDGLHPHFLKICAHNIAKPLASIFQESFDTGQLPMDWKQANVCPIFKK